jgi:hypothetical protein
MAGKKQQKKSALQYVWIGMLILMLLALVIPLVLQAFTGA